MRQSITTRLLLLSVLSGSILQAFHAFQTTTTLSPQYLYRHTTLLDSSFSYQGRLDQYDDNFRCGYVSILGAPNMGKSTLLNALLQENLCIATPRPQTTRHAILGLLTTNNTQVCLVDTPGVIETPAYKLQEGMMEAVTSSMIDADVLLVVTDLFSTPIPDDDIFLKIQQSRKPVIVVINKIDLAAKVQTTDSKTTATVEQAVALWRQLLPQALAILPCTSQSGPDDAGVVALRRILCGGPDVPAALRNLGRPIAGMFASASTPFLTDEQAQALLPHSPPLYDPETLTDRTERFVASELIRAALFETLKKELPYCCQVQVTEFKEPKEEEEEEVNENDPTNNKKKKKKAPIIRISASIIVERESQKWIVVGKQGDKIKQVGIAAREKLQDFLQSKVNTCTAVFFVVLH